jgi:hypothetical protein
VTSGDLGLDAGSAERQKVREAAQEARRLWRGSLETRFRELAEQWRRETGMYSAISKKVQHPAYRSIIDLGEEALPLILRELRDRPGHWFTALRALTKESPVPVGERADPKRARAAWLKWGQEQGLIE